MLARLVSVSLLAAAMAGQAAAQPALRRPQPRRPIRLATVPGFAPVDSWFSYGAEGENARGLIPDISAEDKADVPFGGVAEEIIVIGERERREFSLLRPSDELTGPRALDAAQPVVPWPGTTCTYKNLCYDMSQPPLRATLPRLAAALFGD